MALKNDDPSVRSYGEWLVPQNEGRRDPVAPALPDSTPSSNSGLIGGGRVQLAVPPPIHRRQCRRANGVKSKANINDGDRQVTIQEECQRHPHDRHDTKDGKQGQEGLRGEVAWRISARTTPKRPRSMTNTPTAAALSAPSMPACSASLHPPPSSTTDPWM